MTDWKSTAEIATRQAESLQASNNILRAEILSLTQAHAAEVSQLHQEIDYLGRARDEISSGRMDSALMEIAREETTQAVCKERDQAHATIAEMTQEVARQTANNNALYQELFEEESPEGQIYSAELTRARATVAELREGIEQVALDLSSAGAADTYCNAIRRINNIEHKARALLAALSEPGDGGE